MESETVKIVMLGALLLVAASLLWAIVWYPLKAAIWGDRNEGEELPIPTDEDRKRLEETMSSRLGPDWREKVLNGKI